MASSLEVNKALAAILVAGIIASGSGVVSRILFPSHVLEESAYQIDTAAVEATGEEAAGEEEVASIGELLAVADADAGASVAKKCTACHSIEQGGPNKIGPGLWGVVNRPLGDAADFAYSGAIVDHGGAWDYESLNAFLTNPKEWAPGTKMAFAGLKKPEDRANLILYLRSLADSPEPLPEGG